jgi:TolB protein
MRTSRLSFVWILALSIIVSGCSSTPSGQVGAQGEVQCRPSARTTPEGPLEDIKTIAVLPFLRNDGGGLPEDVAGIITADLVRSGRFSIIPQKDLLAFPRDPNEVDPKDWQSIGVEYLLLGKVELNEPGIYRIKFYLMDTACGVVISGYQFNIKEKQLRPGVHSIANKVYESLENRPGIFRTRLAYVETTVLANGEKEFSLMIADIDGGLTQNIARSARPFRSPDGRSIVFTSDRSGENQIYRIPVSGGEVQRMTFRGNDNANAEFSPSGKQLCYVTQVNGKYRIALQDIESGSVRLLSHGNQDGSPRFSPNGDNIVYESNIDGKAVLVVISTNGRVRQNIAVKDADISDPAWSPALRKSLP